MVLVLTSTILLIGGLADCGADSAPRFPVVDKTNYAEVLQAIRKNELNDEELRSVVSALPDVYLRTQDNAILHALVQLRLRDETAAQPVDAALPRFREMIANRRLLRNTSSEVVLCDLFDMLVGFETIPVEMDQVVQEWFSRPENRDRHFARPKAAAVLLTFEPERKTYRDWLEGALDHSKPHVRWTAAAALGSAGEAARATLPRLKRLLDDESAAVRVRAAEAVWKIEQQAETVLPTLIASFGENDRSVPLKPRGVSEWDFSHRHVAVILLGEMQADTPEVVEALLTLLDRDDSTMRLLVLRALAQIDAKVDRIRQAVQARLKDSHAAVRAEAQRLLRKTNEESQRQC